jgi:hypothetical protein
MKKRRSPNRPATIADLRRTERTLRGEIRKCATKKDLRRFVTRADARRFATKDDLKRFATKDDLKRFATKDDLKRFATKDDLKRFATKDDLKAYPTKQDLSRELARELGRWSSELWTRVQVVFEAWEDRFDLVIEGLTATNKRLDKVIAMLEHQVVPTLHDHESRIGALEVRHSA